MNKGSLEADAPVPPAGTEHTADQPASQQQAAPPAESGTPDAASSVLDVMSSAAEVIEAVFSIS